MKLPQDKSEMKASSGPWSAAAITRRALDDLTTIAQVMHIRQRHPDDILHALAEQAALWRRQGADLDEHDVLRTVRALLPDYQPYADLEHALMQNRIAEGIAAMQRQISGQAYRDGFVDAGGLTREGIEELIREVVVRELPDLLRAMGFRIGGTAA